MSVNKFMFVTLSSICSVQTNSQISKLSSSTMTKSAALIFLHGRGGSGQSWKDEIQLLAGQHVKCICPDAPIRPITINMGMEMPAWFDRISSNSIKPEDGEGVKESCTIIHNLIEEQIITGIEHDRIMIAGFSQGGAMALYSALRYPKKLAGVLALSCWLPLADDFPEAAQKENLTTPMLQCHGTHDEMINLSWVLSGNNQLPKMKTFLADNYTFKTYANLGHETCAEEMNDAKQFIAKCLGQQSS